MTKIWFITGTSKGFGRVWAEVALERGDKVAATARDVSSLQALNKKYGEKVLTLALDVTNKTAVDEAVKQAHDHFGRLDVVINNAGYGLFGAIEEISEQEARDQLETNVFGALWVTQAACHISVSKAVGISSRSQASAVSTPSPTSACTTRANGHLKRLVSHSARRCNRSASRLLL